MLARRVTVVVLAAGAACVPASAANTDAVVPATRLAAPPASARTAADAPPVYVAPLAPGATTLHLRYGPMNIKPGQNLIAVDLLKERPPVEIGRAHV